MGRNNPKTRKNSPIRQRRGTWAWPPGARSPLPSPPVAVAPLLLPLPQLRPLHFGQDKVHGANRLPDFRLYLRDEFNCCQTRKKPLLLRITWSLLSIEP